MPAPRIDFSAFSEPLDRAESRAFDARLKASQPTGRTFAPMGMLIDVIGLVGFVPTFLLFFSLFVSQAITAIAEPSPSATRGVLMMLVLALGSAVMVAWLGSRYIRPLRRSGTWWRLDRFARQNGLVFSPWSPAPDYPSVMFTTGAEPAAYDHVRSQSDDYFDIGNLTFQTGRTSAESIDNRWGFVAIHLDRALPHLVLDARANNLVGLTTFPGAFDRNQRHSLGETYDKHFTLYAPSGSERAAEGLFTSDVLRALVEFGPSFDIEVSGEWLFAFSRRPFDMRDGATVESLLRFVDVIGSTFEKRVDRLTADETGGGGVKFGSFGIWEGGILRGSVRRWRWFAVLVFWAFLAAFFAIGQIDV